MFKSESLLDKKLKSDAVSKEVQEVSDEIAKEYTKDLDKYVHFIRSILKDGENPPSIQELEDYCINLPVLIYYASEMQEKLGINDDISKSLYKRAYNTHRMCQEVGTVADKTSIAEELSNDELIISICYKRAYTIVKNKVDAAQELLSSCKKIITRRISEQELTRIS